MKNDSLRKRDGKWQRFESTERKKIEVELEEARNKLELKVEQRTEELAKTNRQLIKEILERKEIERVIRVRSAILKMIGKASSRKEYLDILVKFIKGLTGCRCAGLRVLNAEGDIPYESYIGFSREFWEKENWLSVLRDQCACIRVVTGRPILEDKPCMSSGGSFVSNDALAFVETLSKKEKALFRGVCIESGFNSVAVIPIRYKDEVIAAIHIADERKNMMPAASIEFIELLTPLIGEGIHKFDIEDKIRQSHVSQSLISALIRYSFEEISIEKMLNRSLELLLSMSWLAIESKGCVFLTEEGKDTLILKAQKNLPAPVRTMCARLAYGDCLCGKAAQDKKIQFVSTVDKSHSITYAGMPPHGHYCIPIMFGEKLLGIINLYLPEKYRRDLIKEEFLSTFANALAGIIERSRTEEDLKKSEHSLAEAQRIAHLGNWDWNIVTNDLHWSDEIYRIFGLTPREFGATYDAFLNYVHPEDREFVRSEVNKALAGDKEYSIDHRVVRPEGSVRIVHEQAEVMFDSKGSPMRMIGTVQDITKEKLSEEKLKEAQNQLERARRLSDIGTLAATVAHELRNPLAAMRMAAFNIKRKAQNPLLDKHLFNIEKKISESDQIINNLLFYSRLRTPHYESVDLYKIMEESLEIAKKHAVKNEVIIKKKYRVLRRVLVDADSLQMKELFANILNNAYDAMHGKTGSIEIGATLDEDSSVKIYIKDTGVGMDKELLARCHEPFFSTKTKGTGLGLTVCFQIVSLHSGRIDIASQKDKGTTVTVELPTKRNGQKDPHRDANGDAPQSTTLA